MLALSTVLSPAAPEAEPAVEAASQEAVPSDKERKASLLESAAMSLEAIRNLEAKFTQIAPSGNITTGKLFLSRPGRLRFEYDEPSPMLIVATGGLVYLHDSELETVESYPVSQTPLRFLLARQLDLDSAQIVSVEENQHGLKIILAAKDEDLQGQLALIFDPEPHRLAGWSFLDPAGELTVVSLDDVEEKKRLKSRLFRVPEAGGLGLRDN